MADFDPKATWDRISGIASDHQEETSYLREMFLSTPSTAGIGLSVIGGLLLSMPLGLGFAAVPVVAFLTAEAVAAVFIPSSPVFREWVDRKKRQERRDRIREGLLNRIQANMAQWEDDWGDSHDPWIRECGSYRLSYNRMRERLASLRTLAADDQTNLSFYDIEKLDETTLDFLRLLYSRIHLRERMGQGDGPIRRQIADIEEQLENTQSSVDRRRLEQAKKHLQAVLERRARLPAKDTATAAQMTAMADTFEEMYHRVTSNPGGGVSGFLQDALARMNIEEELSSAVEEELVELDREVTPEVEEGLRRVRAAAAARTRQSH